MTTQLIGRRIRALREERKHSQERLAEMFGFNDRQTVSAIETGVRRVTAEELVLAVERLGAPLEYFTDPFLLVGEGRFSWRQSGVDVQQLEAYERRAGRWIAAYRTLAPRVGRETPLMRRTLGLFRRSSVEDAIRAGERFVAEFGLGDVPATRLADVMERELGILVLMVDADRGISGAACRLPELDAVLIARHEVEGRRHFDLAHELFHLLTWDAMPPEHWEEARETGGNRVEQLANNFAAAVLMPADTLARLGNWSELGQAALVARLNAVANELHVTASALKWRLVALGALTSTTARAVPDAALRHNGRDEAENVPPALFSRPFMEILGLAVGQELQHPILYYFSGSCRLATCTQGDVGGIRLGVSHRSFADLAFARSSSHSGLPLGCSDRRLPHGAHDLRAVEIILSVQGGADVGADRNS